MCFHPFQRPVTVHKSRWILMFRSKSVIRHNDRRIAKPCDISAYILIDVEVIHHERAAVTEQEHRRLLVILRIVYSCLYLASIRLNLEVFCFHFHERFITMASLHIAADAYGRFFRMPRSPFCRIFKIHNLWFRNINLWSHIAVFRFKIFLIF